MSWRDEEKIPLVWRGKTLTPEQEKELLQGLMVSGGPSGWHVYYPMLSAAALYTTGETRQQAVSRMEEKVKQLTKELEESVYRRTEDLKMSCKLLECGWD